ncbi:alkaline phosphatase family protein [Halococcus sediminicola]|uniref:hypothetical protein n=1 Tax=Halococcus sediminicola TaxID=1264579 RepID=UPI000679292D|nr:hypothetical protein [Halococcus sediminicola]
MGLSDWLKETSERIAAEGVDGARESAYELRVGALRRADDFANTGTNIYDRSWDALVILDGCRPDVLRGIAPEYSFLDSSGTHRSPGSASYQWMERTFTDKYADEMAKTLHVTANPHSGRFFDRTDFLELNEVWRDQWDEDLGTVPARPVTDRAIHTSRKHNADRLIVHYMQPHFPSIPQPLSSGVDLDNWLGGAEHAWQQLRRGTVSKREVWRSYVDNLRYVLDDVRILLENLNANRTVITADHGNAKGEWGIYGHPNVPLDVLRKVPWFVTTANDCGGYDPDIPERIDELSATADERLKALGYAKEKGVDDPTGV